MFAPFPVPILLLNRGFVNLGTKNPAKRGVFVPMTLVGGWLTLHVFGQDVNGIVTRLYLKLGQLFFADELANRLVDNI